MIPKPARTNKSIAASFLIRCGACTSLCPYDDNNSNDNQEDTASSSSFFASPLAAVSDKATDYPQVRTNSNSSNSIQYQDWNRLLVRAEQEYYKTSHTTLTTTETNNHNNDTMPTLFRSNKSKKNGTEDDGDVQPDAPPRKGGIGSKLFGKKKKNKKNNNTNQIMIMSGKVDADPTEEDPSHSSSAELSTPVPEDATPVVVHVEVPERPPIVEKAPSKDDSVPTATEHTVTSVESDVSSETSVTESPEVDAPFVAAVEEELASVVAVAVKETVVAPELNVEESDDGPACYLLYEPDSSGRLVEHYSQNPVENAVGRFVARGGKKIAGFKFTRNAGRNVLIGSCSAGVQGRKNYCNGWCQFVRSCKILQGDVTILQVAEGVKAMPVDVYLYYDRPAHQTVKLEFNTPLTTDKLLAVACLPRSSPFFVTNDSVDVMKWLQDARNYGYSTKI